MANMANSSITYSNALAKINNKPLKCIITNNKNSIRYLSDSGSMIIYSDPSKQDYYEIYIGGKFISGGYGFPKDQYNQLSYLASTYNYTYTDIWNSINNIKNQTYSYYNELIDTKLDKTGNSSYTYIVYTDDYENEYNIPLKSFIDLYTNLPTYNDLTIDNVEYTIYDTNGNVYSNKDTILEGTILRSMVCRVYGTINDSGGVGSINIVINKSNSNDEYPSIIRYNASYDPSDSNKFEIEISRTFNDTDIVYDVKLGKNELFNKFELSILETPSSKYKTVTIEGQDGSSIIVPISFSKIKEHTIEVEKPILYGVPILKYSYDNLNDLNDDQITESVNQMNNIELRYHSLESEPVYTFIPVTNNTKTISIWYDHNNYSILNAWYIDKTRSNSYDVKEFMYKINDDIVSFTAVNEVLTDNIGGLPYFINNNGFNDGILKLELISHSSSTNNDMLMYTNRYWIPSKYLTS